MTDVSKLHTVVTNTTFGRNASGNIPTAVPMSHLVVASYAVGKSVSSSPTPRGYGDHFIA
ncbi:hypothetical protein L195_g023311 [Trifolium pratense]|uniref:Uncharacterized protein n=1 Tax=Trifolium pratense TaxID=57577 RepID=A0A2K3L286_TRIPR|nr:hypothetical protein L195_g028545 [Trifolium pratense]PNY00037.1 hypothetical protein L195_g023311 [Trifolium pratense]